MNKFGCRAVTIAGSILASGCLLASVWAKSIVMLYFTAGIGTGTYPPPRLSPPPFRLAFSRYSVQLFNVCSLPAVSAGARRREDAPGKPPSGRSAPDVACKALAQRCLLPAAREGMLTCAIRRFRNPGDSLAFVYTHLRHFSIDVVTFSVLR